MVCGGVFFHFFFFYTNSGSNRTLPRKNLYDTHTHIYMHVRIGIYYNEIGLCNCWRLAKQAKVGRTGRQEGRITSRPHNQSWNSSPTGGGPGARSKEARELLWTSGESQKLGVRRHQTEDVDSVGPPAPCLMHSLSLKFLKAILFRRVI